MGQTTTVNGDQYRTIVTLWKAFVTFLTAMTGGEVALYAIPLPEDVESFQLRWPVYATAMAFAVWRAWENVRKQLGILQYPWENES